MTRPTSREWHNLDRLYGGDGSMPKELGIRPPRAKAVKAVKLHPSEWDEQVAVIGFWNRFAPTKGLEPELLYSVPNGAHLANNRNDPSRRAAQTNWLKMSGMRVGAVDLVLDVARNNFHGLRLEMKSLVGSVDPNQTRIHEMLRRQGYKVSVCYGADEAIAVLKDYLQ